MTTPEYVDRTVPNTVEVVIAGEHLGNQQATVLHIHTLTPGDTSKIAQILNAVNTQILQKYLACLHTSYQAVELRGQDISVRGGVQVSVVMTGNTHGTNPGASAPGNVAIAIGWRTAYGGRRFRGRTYLSPLSTSNFTNDTISVGLVAAMHVFGDAYIQLTTGVVSEGPVVASKTYHDSHRIQTYRFDTTLDSMRRRLTGRGN